MVEAQLALGMRNCLVLFRESATTRGCPVVWLSGLPDQCHFRRRMPRYSFPSSSSRTLSSSRSNSPSRSLSCLLPRHISERRRTVRGPPGGTNLISKSAVPGGNHDKMRHQHAVVAQEEHRKRRRGFVGHHGRLLQAAALHRDFEDVVGCDLHSAGVSRSRLPSSGWSSPAICFVVAISLCTRAGSYCSSVRTTAR